VNGLTGALLTHNPNFLNSANAAGAINPFRLDRSEVLTCDNINRYTVEQKAYDRGLLDLFPTYTSATTSCPIGVVAPPGVGDGLLRWQHCHGPVELRSAVRNKRQFLCDRIWHDRDGAH
jgi:hypothetical protein